MANNKELDALLQILSGEQTIIQRTDQKAFTLLSILGAFMVFFIVHFTKMQLDMVIFSLIMIYFPAAMGTIYFLVRVLIPRVRGAKELNDNPDEEQTEDINPTFFAGISQFNTPNEYAKYLKSIANDEKKLYKMFSAQVFSLGLINQRKNNSLRKSMIFFVTALVSELLIIMYLAYLRAYSYLDDRVYQFIDGITFFSIIAITISRYDLFTKIKNLKLELNFRSPNRQTFGLLSFVLIILSLLLPWTKIGDISLSIWAGSIGQNNFDWIGILLIFLSSIILITNVNQKPIFFVSFGLIFCFYRILRIYTMGIDVPESLEPSFGSGGFIIIFSAFIQLYFCLNPKYNEKNNS
mgnify:CR=1 FL=1